MCTSGVQEGSTTSIILVNGNGFPVVVLEVF